jgi:hypothetical protein
MSTLYDRHIQDYVYGKYIEAKQAGKGRLFALSVNGAAEIERRVAGLKDLEKDKAIRAGLRSGGLFFAKQGKMRLSQRILFKASNYRAHSSSEEDLRKKIRRREIRNHKRIALSSSNLYNSFQVRVKRRSLGALVGFSSKGHHAHLVDLGTRRRPHPITGTSGVMPANFFWTDTSEQDWKVGMDRVMDGIGRAINRIMLRRD